MSSSTSVFIRQIQRVFPETVWHWLIRALRHDPLVWEFLISEAGQKSVDLSSGRQESLSPANLALLAMHYPISAESLREEPMQPVDLENLELPAGEPGLTLAQAGKDALCLRERRRLLGSWNGLNNDLLALSPTAVACLFGMLSAPQEPFHVLLAGATSQGSLEQAATLTAHALLSNPQSPAGQYGFATQLLQDLPPAACLEFIKKVQSYAPRLSADLAGDLAAHLQKTSITPSSADENALLEQVSALAKAAEAGILAEHAEQAARTIDASIKAARMLEARLTARKARFLSAQGDDQAALQAWEAASQLDPSSAALVGQTAMALLDAGRTADAQNVLASAQGPAALIHIARARLAFLRDNEEQARSETRQSLELLEAGDTECEPAPPLHTLPAAHLAGLLMQLNQPAQAARAAQIAASQAPNDADIYALLARAQWASGDWEGAVVSSQISTCLEPSRLDLRRELTERLELAEDWEAALLERKSLNEKLDPPSIEDLHALSECALNAGDVRLCLQVCEQILEQEPQDGIALAWQGEAQAALGEIEPALESLHQAIQVAPSLAIPWLSLAKVYQGASQPQKALETLRAATYAVPDDALIHLKLGEAYIEGGSPTQALSDLRLAAELADQDQSALNLS